MHFLSNFVLLIQNPFKHGKRNLSMSFIFFLTMKPLELIKNKCLFFPGHKTFRTDKKINDIDK